MQFQAEGDACRGVGRPQPKEGLERRCRKVAKYPANVKVISERTRETQSDSKSRVIGSNSNSMVDGLTYRLARERVNS